MLVTNGLIHSKVVNALKYAVFVGSITEVIEIGQNEFNNTINTYIAGKAYSQAIAGANEGLNAKLLTTISGLRKNVLDNMIIEAKKNNVDTEHMIIMNDIENDIKIVFKDKDNNKIQEKDILKGSAEALSEDIIEKNEEMLKKSSIIVCQTKINKNAIKKLIEIASENNIPLILYPSRSKEISIINNKENEELLNKISIMICEDTALKDIFGQDIIEEDILKKYKNKLIVLDSNDIIRYFDGEKIVAIHSESGKLQKVGEKDVFIGKFVKNYLEKENITDAINESI